MWTAVAIAILGLVALVLFIPLELIVRCERRPWFRFHLGFRWLFGLVNKDIEPEGDRVVEESAPAKPRRKGRRRKARRPVHVVAMLSTRGFLSGAARLLRRLAHAFRVHDLFVWLRAGFEDPADTGLLCSFLLPTVAYLEARHPGHWDVAPVFSAPALGFALSARVSVTPARLLWPVLTFGFSPSTIRGLLALRAGEP
jgi:hypothetical protein